MLLPFKNAKTYGVIHTENYFTFLGFCKNVNNDEIQKIDVFLNDELIDTIDANKNLQKINDLYDIDGFSFIYNLSEIYIGEKNKISFRNHKTKEELQNSPYFLIDKTHPKFNELSFLYSLTLPIDKNKINDIYCPNNIGFLAFGNFIEDKEFINYINYICDNFTYKLIGFCFSNEDLEKSTNIFSKKVHFRIIQNINDLRINIELFIWGYAERNFSNKIISKLINKNIFQVCFNLSLKNQTLEESYNKNPNLNFIHQNLIKLNFDVYEIEKSNNNIYIHINKIAKKYIPSDIWENITPKTNSFYIFNELFLKYIMVSKEFKEFYFDFYTNLRSLFHTENLK